MKKVLALFSGIVGFVLLLAGLGLITLTQTLLLYGGVVLLIVATFLFLKG